jgi:Na+/proline symporter
MTLASLDWVVIVAYFIIITAIGLIAGRYVRKTGQFFLGERRFGPWVMIGQSFGVGTHAEMPVSLAGAVYTNGASAIWFQWKNLFITPFYWIMAPIFRRIRRTTMAEFTEDRYGSWMGAIYIVFATCYLVINTGSMLKGAGKVISQATGGGVGVNEIVIAMTVLFVLYSYVGGLVAAAWTDLFQSILIIVLSFLLIPVGWSLVGGLPGMHASLPPHFFTLATPSGIGPWAILMLTINGLIGIMAMPHQIAANGTGRDERTCRIGMMAGNMVKRFCTVGWMLVGLIVAAVIAQGGSGAVTLNDPEDAFGFACRLLLGPGALGLMIASILAANMSTCSAFLVDSGALFTEGLYRRHIAPGRPDPHYLLVGRVSGVAVTMLGVLYALYLIESVLYSFLLTETMSTFIGISVFGGIIWRRANRWGALASLLGAFTTNFALYWWTGQRLDHWDPNVFLAALLVGTFLLVAVSLATAPEPAKDVDAFMRRLQTSSDGKTETDSHHAGKDPLMLVDILHLGRRAKDGLWRTYREDLWGFWLAWAIVAVLVTATALVLGIGAA